MRHFQLDPNKVFDICSLWNQSAILTEVHRLRRRLGRPPHGLPLGHGQARGEVGVGGVRGAGDGHPVLVVAGVPRQWDHGGAGSGHCNEKRALSSFDERLQDTLHISNRSDKGQVFLLVAVYVTTCPINANWA